MAICTYQEMEVWMMARVIEIKEKIVNEHVIHVDGKGPFEVVGYAYSYLSKLSQMGYVIEVKELIERHGGSRLSNVPIENYKDFLEEVLKLYKEKTEV